MKQLIFIITFLSYVLLGCQRTAKYDLPTKNLGSKIPPFSIQLVSSGTFLNVNQIPPSRKTVFIYVSPFCPYCRAMIHDLIDNYKSFKNVTFYLVSDYPLFETKKITTDFHLNNYSNILVGLDSNNQIGSHYKIKSLPYTLVYNDDLILIAEIPGRFKITRLNEFLNPT